jgi:hypothetical protein
MKKFHIPFVLLLMALTACSSVPRTNSLNEKDPPETVEITYHIQMGREQELQAVLNRAWAIYNAEHLVIPQSHAMVMSREYGNRPRIVETLTWVSHSAPDHASKAISDVWNQIQDLCEPRAGHDGVEMIELKGVGPKK